jgi:hypothetical protein
LKDKTRFITMTRFLGNQPENSIADRHHSAHK